MEIPASVRPAETHTAVKVGVRLRPLVSHERRQQPCLAINGSDVSVVPGSLSEGNGRESLEGPWRFDHAMDSSNASGPNHVDNYAVYNILGRGIVEHALQGYNACLFCYGQTGTGKTATIFGNKQAGPGFLILLLKDLFEAKSREESQGNSVDVSVQMLEIYNEKVFDLFTEAQTKIVLHVLPESVQIKGAEVKLVESVDECLHLINQGSQRKHTAATAANPNSSRGHTIIKLVIQRAQRDEGIHLASEIYLADLAGHENEKTTKVTGDRLVELSFINKSLMWLESALNELASRQNNARHIVSHNHAMALFRNSKLTLILSQALLGNSLAHIIVTLSPAAEHFGVSLSSLRFANKVKRIMVDAHSSAHTDAQTQIRNLEAEVKQLKERLNKFARAIGEYEAEVKQLKERLATANNGLSAVLEAEVKQLREQLVAAKAAPSTALQAEMTDLREKLAKAMSVPKSSDAEVKQLKLEAEVKYLREQLIIAQDAAPAALESNVRQLREQVGITVAGPSVANKGSASISKANDRLVGLARDPGSNLDSEGTASATVSATASAGNTPKQLEDVLLPWNDMISQITKMPPELLLEQIHAYKAENEKVCQRLQALLPRSAPSEPFRAEMPERAPSPVPVMAGSYTGWNEGPVNAHAAGSPTPSSPPRSISPRRTGFSGTYAVGLGSAKPSSPLHTLRSTSPEQRAALAATPSSPLHSGSPPLVSRSPNVYLSSTPSRATLIRMRSAQSRVANPQGSAKNIVAIPVMADTADVSPIRMRSAQSIVSSPPGVAEVNDVGPIRMRSAQNRVGSPPASAQNMVTIACVADATDAGTMRVRSGRVSPGVADVTDVSPMQMRSVQNLAGKPCVPDASDWSPSGMQVRSGVISWNQALSPCFPDATDGSPMRIRSALTAHGQESAMVRHIRI